MLFSTADEVIENLNVPHTTFELLGSIERGEPIILDYQKGQLILDVEKIEITKEMTWIHARVVPTYGELHSIKGYYYLLLGSPNT
jgi:hypothetical protein